LEIARSEGQRPGAERRVRGGDDVRNVHDDGCPDQAVLCFFAIVELANLRLVSHAARSDCPVASLGEDGSVESLTELRERRAFC
jgi:hypothetical protein